MDTGKLSSALVAVSAAALAAGVLCAAPGPDIVHARLMGLVAVPLFYVGVLVSYLYGLSPPGLRGASSLLSTAAALLVALASLAPGYAWLLVPASAAPVAAVAAATARLRSGAWREAGLLTASAAAVTLASLPLLHAYRAPLLREVAALYGLVAPGVYAVNTYSLLRSYGRRSLAGLAPMALLAAGLLLRATGQPPWRPLLALSFASYAALVAVGAAAARGRLRRLRGDARRGHAFFLTGQLVSAATAGLHAYLLAAGADPVTEAHSLAMGFIASHVYTHAPLMLPTILGVPAPRRYSGVPHGLLAASLVLRLWGPSGYAAPVYAASLVALLYTTLPLPIPWQAARAQ